MHLSSPYPGLQTRHTHAVWALVLLAHVALILLWPTQRKPGFAQSASGPTTTLTYVRLPVAEVTGRNQDEPARSKHLAQSPLPLPSRPSADSSAVGSGSVPDAVGLPSAADAVVAAPPASSPRGTGLDLTLPAGTASNIVVNPAVHDERSNSALLTAWQRFDRSVREAEKPPCFEPADTRADQLDPFNPGTPKYQRCKKPP